MVKIPSVSRGDRISDKFTAETFNAFARVANEYRTPVLPGNEIAVQLPWIYNDSDVDLEPFQVLQLSIPLFPETSKQLGDFRDLGSWVGIKPDSSGCGNFAVLATQAKQAKMGRFYRGPEVPVRVNITHAWIDLCDLVEDTHILATNPAGSARILWKESASGADVRCRVQLGQVVDRFYWGVAISEITAGGSGTVRISEPGGAGWYDVEDVKLEHLHEGLPIAASTGVRIWFSQLDKEWHIDGAACP